MYTCNLITIIYTFLNLINYFDISIPITNLSLFVKNNIK